MHDLNTINRLNREATDKYLETTRSKGKWVAAFYTGLHIVTWCSFDTERRARDYVADQNTAAKSPDSYWRVLAPISALHGLKRDQSEDRQTPTVVVLTGDGKRHELDANLIKPEYINKDPYASQPDTLVGGWIGWAGGECPEQADTKVRAQLRGGATIDRRAGALDWSHLGTDGDIVAYRVVKEDKPEQAETRELTLGDVISRLERLEQAFREEFGKVRPVK